MVEQRDLQMAEYFHRHPHRNILSAIAAVIDPSSSGAAAERASSVYYDYCDTSLSNLWRRQKGWVEEETTRHCLHDLMRGLAHMHHHGIVHRDIKPANLLIHYSSQGMCLKIGDFGWSRGVPTDSGIMTPGAITAVYRAPEVHMRLAYSFPVDVWAAGLVARELLTGWRLHELTNYKEGHELRLCRAAGGLIDVASWPGLVAG